MPPEQGGKWLGDANGGEPPDMEGSEKPGVEQAALPGMKSMPRFGASGVQGTAELPNRRTAERFLVT
jgi:hypothetical protein